MSYPTKKLGEVCEINMGQSPASSTYNDNKNGLPFYQGKKDYGVLYPTPRTWCSKPIKIVEAGDVLISVRAPVGALNVTQEKSCIGRGLAGLHAKKELYQEFLFQFLKLKEQDIAELGTGSTFTAISKKHLENLEIPLPTVGEQKKIVAKIEKQFAKIDEAARLRAESAELADELLPSALHEIFSSAESKGWEFRTVGEICELNPKKSEIKDISDDIQVSFVPMSAVDEYLQVITLLEKRKLGKVRRGYTYFRNGDVLFAKITPCMENGKVAIARNLENDVGFGTTEFHVIRAKSAILPEWIRYVIGSPSFREVAKTTMTGSAGQKRVPIHFLEKFKIPLPPLAEQKAIVKKLDALAEKARTLRELQSCAGEHRELLVKS